MADGTHIQWTDATWNIITGCSLASPGCTNCYAMRLAGSRLRHHPSRVGLTTQTKAGPVWTGEVRFNEQWLDQPLRWTRGRKIFVCAHGDLFHENVPDEWIDRVFAVMALCPQHTFQVLTKRAHRMREYCTYLPDVVEDIQEAARKAGGTLLACKEAREKLEAGPLPNVWLGVSAEDQPRWDERVGMLRHTPAAKRWVSVEPMLGPIADDMNMSGLDWIVVGGESGRRPRNPEFRDHARALRDQCAGTGVAFYGKQDFGGKEMPADLDIKEFPA